MSLRVYVAGPPGANEYRLPATELLIAAGHVPVDPFRRDFRGKTVGHEEEIVTGDLRDIDECDAVLADFSEADEGTAMEAWYARSTGTPIVAHTGGRTPHPWVVYVARSLHADLEPAVAALSAVEPRARRSLRSHP